MEQQRPMEFGLTAYAIRDRDKERARLRAARMAVPHGQTTKVTAKPKVCPSLIKLAVKREEMQRNRRYLSKDVTPREVNPLVTRTAGNVGMGEYYTPKGRELAVGVASGKDVVAVKPWRDWTCAYLFSTVYKVGIKDRYIHPAMR